MGIYHREFQQARINGSHSKVSNFHCFYYRMKYLPSLLEPWELVVAVLLTDLAYSV